ncbi:hypothetical protein AKJ35_00815, partial [candidate division MSBL1 archaeon SCGC-AAA833F18]
MTKKFADLHVHTQASDGEYTPEEAVRKAHEAGLAAIGISDHDSVGGIKEALEAGEAKSICRPHIARVMLKRGHIEEFQDAFNQYIGNDCPAYVKRYEMSPPDAIQTIRNAVEF